MRRSLWLRVGIVLVVLATIAGARVASGRRTDNASSQVVDVPPGDPGPAEIGASDAEAEEGEGGELVPEEGSAREEGDEILQQQDWFYSQRAYPGPTIPPGALAQARAEATALARRDSGRAAPTATLTWTSFGPAPIKTTSVPQDFDGPAPYAGRVTAVAHDPTDAATAYLGSAGGGVWKTTNSGGNWTPLFDKEKSLSIGAIAVDPQSSSTVYVGTGENNRNTDAYFGAGILRSTNGGTSWAKIGGSTFTNCYVGSLIVSPTSSTTLYAGVGNRGRYSTSSTCANGVYRSVNGGGTWARLISGPVNDLVLKPGTPSTIYAGFQGSGIWTSSNSGDSGTWSRMTGNLPTSDLGRVAIGVTPANASRIYAAFGNASTGEALGLWTSTDSGASWTKLPYQDFCAYSNNDVTGQCNYDLAITVFPSDEKFVYVGGIRLMRYDGSNWSTMGYNQTNGIHVDIHSLNFDADKRLWVGSDGGAYLKAGGQTGFSNLNATLGITQLYPGTSGTASGTFLAGSQDNGNIAYNGGSWNQFITGDGGYTAYDSVNAWKFAEYVHAEAYKVTSTGLRTCLFTTDSRHQTTCNQYAAESSAFISPLIQSPSSRSTLFIGTDRIWRTTNSGGAWSTASPRFAGTVSAIAQAKSDSNSLYAAWSGNSSTQPFVAYTTDGGANWFSTATLPNRAITDIQVKVSAPKVAWVTFSGYNTGHVYLTQDRGATWTDISGNLPNAPVNRIAVDSRTSPSTLYVATDVGVFWSIDGGATWANTSSGLPNAVVTDIRVDAASNKLIAATYGRGAFSASIP